MEAAEPDAGPDWLRAFFSGFNRGLPAVQSMAGDVLPQRNCMVQRKLLELPMGCAWTGTDITMSGLGQFESKFLRLCAETNLVMCMIYGRVGRVQVNL
ncbi:hypothetical protein MPH_01858 [Macrophomina phaseolina MS6]|uniref:Uncharacterized protein n=1 Tax=Macrophomina phaseolina (strain MS6) TaxID=1126212 RepID=K2SEF8_MACPH|nr:hypothetical protein MPH_01858 [Macrophomina phaseolina MS6]